MKRSKALAYAAFCIAAVLSLPRAEEAGRLSIVEGKVSLLRSGSEKWVPARPNMGLKTGDQLYTREESFAEVTYVTGAVLRMDENTKITLTAASKTGTKTKSGVGNVWVNMRKLVRTGGKKFELATPTALASIRGTKFNATTNPDSSTDIAVFDGTVAVGPSGDAGERKGEEKRPDGLAPGEVPGPEEVPGPYEVTLEEWRSIIAGQRIRIRGDGKFSQEAFDVTEARAKDAFVKKNAALDKKLEETE
ncbi:MAG: hypothetical protein GF418_16600 [Chitinivibrionales bacterium]|nr:hypothetical protein [Chitinivibrionales bacterium]MBD3397242.1 hypothetical protein [Chitinivibrionales bacterium]